MTLKERVQKLLRDQGKTAQQTEIELSLAKGYLSKLDKSTPSSDIISRLADHLSVTTDFLLGKTKTTICPICEYRYDPLNYDQTEEHDRVHNGFLKAKKKYDYIPSQTDAKFMSESAYKMMTDYFNNYTPDDLNGLLELVEKYIYLDYMYFLRTHHFFCFTRDYLSPDEEYRRFRIDKIDEITQNQSFRADTRKTLREKNNLPPLYNDTTIPFHKDLSPNAIKIAELYMKADPGIQNSVNILLGFTDGEKVSKMQA